MGALAVFEKKNKSITYREPSTPDREPSDISYSFAHRQSEDYVRVIVSL